MRTTTRRFRPGRCGPRPRADGRPPRARLGAPRPPLPPTPASAPSRRARDGRGAFELLGGTGPHGPTRPRCARSGVSSRPLRIDAWLLTDLRGDNPTALDLVRPSGRPSGAGSTSPGAWRAHAPRARRAMPPPSRASPAAGSPTRASATSRRASRRSSRAGSACHGDRRGPRAAGGPSRRDRADAVRAAGVRVVSSGDLRLARARWDEAARAQHSSPCTTSAGCATTPSR